MNLASKKEIQGFLKEKGIRPFKGLGQNFLVNEKDLEKIVQAAQLKKEDKVIEVGPGLGVLTQELVKEAKEVIAVEKDAKLASFLKENLKATNLKVLSEDALKSPTLKEEIQDQYKVVANLPYYITSPVIRFFLEVKKQPELMVLLIQKEVAQRICASPGQMSILAVAVQVYSRPSIVDHISRSSFWPQPKVDSAILKIQPKELTDIDFSHFFKIVRLGFSEKRKQLANNLAKGLCLKKDKIASILKEINLNEKIRAQELSVEDWQKLSEKIKS